MIQEADVLAVLGMLPEHSFVRQYTQYGMTQTASNASYHLGMGLHLAGLCSPPGLVAKGFLADTYPNLWLLLVGSTGHAQKTLALNVGLKLISRAAPTLLGPDPTSEEAFWKNLRAQPTMSLIYPEFEEFFRNTGGGPDNYRSKLLGAYVSFFDCIDRVRKDARGNPIEIHMPRFGLVGACTPRHLEDHTDLGHWEGGFMGRELILYGEAERAFIQPQELPQHQAWLEQWLAEGAALASIQPCQPMSEGARALWQAWCEDVNQRVKEMRDERIRGALARVTLIAAKIATILAYDFGGGKYGRPWGITPEVLRPAMAIGELHYKSARALIGRIASSPEMREMRMVENAIPKDGTWASTGAVAKDAQMTLWRLRRYLDTLMAQGVVGKDEQDGHTFYRWIPDGAPPVYDTNRVAPPPPDAVDGLRTVIPFPSAGG